MPPPQRLKRPKVAMACDFCRRRKIKCDGKQPECGPCHSRGDPNLTCTWNDNRSRLDIRRLQRQIHELQQERVPGYTFSDAVPPGDQSGCNLQRASYPKPLDPEIPASAMLGPVELGPGTHGFFGGSSAGNFVALIRQAVAQQQASSVPRHPSPTTPGIPSPSSSDPPGLLGLSLSLPSAQCPETGQTQWSKLRLDECALPPRRRADSLLSVYWDAVHPLYPFVDRVTIVRQYEHLFSEQAACDIDSALLCTLNIIFAVSCQLDTTAEPDQRRHSTQVFFDRAKRLLDFWNLPPSLGSVQVLLLVAQYLQSTNEPLQFWNFVGSAIRMAESLGLHLKERSENATSIREAEMMRRVWHGCVLLDRVSAMVYGRPTMINRAVAARPPLPIAIDEEELPDGLDFIIPREPEPRKPSRLDFFIQSLELYDILDEILTMLYASKECQDNASTRDRRFCNLFQTLGASVIEIDGRLMAWDASLPQHLRQHESVPDDEQQQRCTVFLRQSVVLRQRFLHVRLLSLRPVLHSLMSSSPSECTLISSFLGPRMAQQSAMICIGVAQEAINLAFTHRDSTWATTGLLAAWWYNVLFVSSAASIMVAARLLHTLPDSAISQDDIAASWTRAMSLLEGYKGYSASIPTLIDILELAFREASSRCVLPSINEPGIAVDAHPPVARTPLDGGMDSAQASRFDWTTFLDPASSCWLDNFPLEM